MAEEAKPLLQQSYDRSDLSEIYRDRRSIETERVKDDLVHSECQAVTALFAVTFDTKKGSAEFDLVKTLNNKLLLDTILVVPFLTLKPCIETTSSTEFY